MKILALALIVMLSGCTATQLKPILDNLSHDCARHYTFAVGALGTTVTGEINCTAEGIPKP